MMKIVPAILAENYEDFVLRIRQAETFAPYVQIDCMDGIFVPTRSIPPETIGDLNTSLSFELHLMVRNPSSFMDKVENSGLKRVLFHFEAEVDHSGFMEILKNRGLSPGLAIKPETPIDDFTRPASDADALLFLTVTPGQYGSSFRPEVLEKVADARRRFPDKLIGVDGGVSLDNLKSFVGIGVDYACVGSRIFLDGKPAENYRSFMEKVNELEKNRDSRHAKSG
ncbi:MAG: hypothetical protein P8013_04165 [Candidatus Sulfobium sp.]|jgi:ribulose-phosphate 3-epimerase